MAAARLFPAAVDDPSRLTDQLRAQQNGTTPAVQAGAAGRRPLSGREPWLLRHPHDHSPGGHVLRMSREGFVVRKDTGAADPT